MQHFELTMDRVSVGHTSRPERLKLHTSLPLVAASSLLLWGLMLRAGEAVLAAL